MAKLNPRLKSRLIAGAFLFFICSTLIYGAVLTKDMRQKLENIRLASAVYDRNGQLIGNLFYYRRIWVPITNISPMLQNAVIAIEDNRFYKHNGIDLQGMTRAVFHDLLPGGALQGGSTITQQLAKIVLLSSERTIGRKIQDITCALEIERTYTKKEILEFYLNSVYLAHGNVGVEAAARHYFGCSAAKLNLSQAATIAAIIRSPENYSPLNHPTAAKKRRDLVLKKMLEQKYISQKQYQAAVRLGLGIAGNRAAPASVGAYFIDYVHEYLAQKLKYTEDELRFGGYQIYTTLDLSYQKAAEQTLAAIPKYQAAVQPQAALVTLNPITGEILAMAGGRDYAKSQLNRAVKAYRQPGSTVKPFVYATAFENGYTAASIFEDQPLTITLPNGAIWKPENYDNIYRGRITLRQALRESVNSVTVQLLQAVGVDTVAAQMERMGINSLVKKGEKNDLNLAPLALGGLTKGVTPLELALAYTPFPNQGKVVKPFAVTKVLDRHGNLLKEYRPEEAKPALSPQAAYITTMLMKDVVEQGTGVRAKQDGFPIAGKTGTTSDYTNAWFAGFTPDRLTVVWIGNDRQETPMRYKNGNIGSALAAEIWGKYMKTVLANSPIIDFAQPEGIIWAYVNPATGQAVPDWIEGASYPEVFAEKTVPEGLAYKLWRLIFPFNKPADNGAASAEAQTPPAQPTPAPAQPGQAPAATPEEAPTPTPEATPGDGLMF
ncbi:MAG: PBP1A family penicillin-binding protein [Firmicutes bacterium]|nr:PBP1A family penicillin-binding protein [Bacillota bacterium]